MILGAHISIAHGLDKMIVRAKAAGCEAVQFFASNPRGWAAAPLLEDNITRFLEQKKSSSIQAFAVHMPYLPNLATSDIYNHRKSIRVLKDNLDRAAQLQADYLVMHPGNSLEAELEVSLAQAAHAINIALHYSSSNVMLLVENTAGQGTQVGVTFKQLAAIIERVKDKTRIGLCIDTAHLYSAGYDLGSTEKVGATLKEFNRYLSFDMLKIIHLNDTNVILGSGRDRHEHIGKGNIGSNGFNSIINHPYLRHAVGIIETPKTTENDDRKNLECLKKMRKYTTGHSQYSHCAPVK